MFRKAPLFALAAALLLAASSCRTTCEEIKELRGDFLDRVAHPTKQPHIVIALPFKLVNKVLAARVKKLKSGTVKIPLVGAVAPGLDRMTVRAEEVKVVGVTDGKVVFRIALLFGVGNTELFGAKLDVEAAVKYDRRRGNLELAFHGESLRAAAPLKITRSVADKVADTVLARLPDIPASVLRGSDLGKIVHRGVNDLLKNLHESLPKSVLGKLESVATIRIAMPVFPVDAVELQATETDAGDLIDIQLFTALPVTDGTWAETSLPRRYPKGRFRVRMSGSAVAELANYGMALGHIPARYSLQGKPDKKGEYTPGFGWSLGKRPLKTTLWKTEEPCKEIRLGGTPSLAVVRRKLVADVTGVKVEEAKGPAGFQAGAWLQSLWTPGLQFSRSAATSIKFDLGGQKMTTRVVDAKVGQNEFILDLTIQ